MDEDGIRQRLLAEQAALQDSSDQQRDGRAPVALDQQSVGRLSRMDALQVQAMAKATEGRRQARLQLIEAALQRLDSGDYGYCVTCGDDIASARLETDPAISLCLACAR